MSDKKHIDRVFQEKFKDFEAVPNDSVWENIQDQLNTNENEETTKARPVWWRYASVAALLLLLLSVGNFIFNNSEKNTPSSDIVDIENSTLDPFNSNTKDSPSILDVQTKNGDVLNKEKNAIVENSDISDINLDKESDSPNSSIIVDASSNEQNKNQDNLIKNNIKDPNNVSVVESNQVKENNSSNNNAIVENSSENKNDTFSKIASKSSDKNKGNPNGDGANILENTNDALAGVNNNNIGNLNTTNTILDENNSSFNINEYGILFSLKGITATELNLNDLVSVDSLSIEEEIANITEEEIINRWGVSPKVAPVYFSNLGNGSSIDTQFNNNSKSSELNMSYGILGSYAISKKIVIRAGINKVDLGYNTNDVIVLQTTGKGPNSNLLQNVSSINTNGQMSIISARALIVEEPSALNVEEDIGLINQRIGYIEVPIELQYNLINRKIGVNVIGGFSSLFLNRNELHSEVRGATTFIGEANNVNKVSYSANFGLGLNYNMSKNFNFNFEPIFKYQLNTFSNTSGDFKPYFIGVYTGFSFKF